MCLLNIIKNKGYKQEGIGYKLVNKELCYNNYITPFEKFPLRLNIYNIYSPYPINTHNNGHYNGGFHIYTSKKTALIALKHCTDRGWDIILIKVKYRKILCIGKDGTSGRDGNLKDITNLVVAELMPLEPVAN